MPSRSFCLGHVPNSESFTVAQVELMVGLRLHHVLSYGAGAGGAGEIQPTHMDLELERFGSPHKN